MFSKKFDPKNAKSDHNFSDSSSSGNHSKQQRQKEALQKLASTFKKKTSEKKPDSWHVLIQNLLNSQRGKLPLLLAVEAGNQSMVRELLSAQTAEQLKVSELIHLVYLLPKKFNALIDYISLTFPPYVNEAFEPKLLTLYVELSVFTHNHTRMILRVYANREFKHTLVLFFVTGTQQINQAL